MFYPAARRLLAAGGTGFAMAWRRRTRFVA
ncbi:MAG: hypothetical protein QOH97_739 [Actinoplanes sp.]|jgi:hypothetical protein|nr:hypothetical protein [Actinoplanes sp.]